MPTQRIAVRIPRNQTDPDAQAFITAAGITDSTQQSAINTLVVNLKAYGIWTKMKALYPMVGGTSTTHKFNLKDPRDLDVAFRLVFNGGWTHSSTGALPNGTNAFADTKLVPSTTLSSINNVHLSNYSRTQNSSISGHDMGVDTFGTNLNLSQYFASVNVKLFMNGGYPNGSAEFNETNTRGLTIGSATSSTLRKLYFNGNLLNADTNTQSTTLPISNLYLGSGRDATGAANYFSSRQIAFASIGDGLTDTEAANFHTAVQAFQTTLGRSIGTQTVSDADAQAFINAAVIDDQVQATAINNLVVGLKADSIWTKMKALYPFVGGTAAQHSYNLRDTAQYYISWNGGWTHSSLGATPNGINAFANTFFNVNSYSNNNHIGYYIRTNIDEAKIDADVFVSFPGASFGINSRASNVAYFGNHIAGTFINFPSTDSRGLWLNTRTTPTLQKVYKNGISQASNTSSGTTAINGNMYFGARNVIGTSATLFSSKQTAFASIGDGLTDAEAANFYTRVQAFQTTLGRQV